MTAPADDMPEKDQSMDDILASIRRIMLDEQARLQDAAAPAAAAAAAAAAAVPAGPRQAAASPAAAETVFAGSETVLLLDSSMAIEEQPEMQATIAALEPVPAVGTALQLMPDSVEFEPVAKMSGIGGVGKTAVGEILPPQTAAVDGPVSVAHEGGFSAEETVPGATAEAAPLAFVTQQSIEALLAPAAAAAAAASVEALLRELNEERRALLQPAASTPSLTIEEVVRSELRPFLKSWLDENLPPLVERLVRVEITRLIGRSGL
jgi:cell pole-organizing protein PopZ